MNVESLENVELQDSPIQYRRQYTAIANLSFRENNSERALIAFSLEHTPYGSVEVTVSVKDDVNWPLVPLLRALKAHIRDLEQRGLLP
jgi:hypothetical protein